MEENKSKVENKQAKVEKKQVKIGLRVIIICAILITATVVGTAIYMIVSDRNCRNSGVDDRFLDKKPIIYLYPKETTELSVKLGKPDNIICSYPQYKDGWNVIAEPNGDLIEKFTGRKLYALYWEGIDSNEVEFKEGFLVEGSKTIEFLEEKLALLGLNEREAEEFILYWLPKLQENKYNLIRFATMEEINRIMPLEISEKPDTIIRVLMQFKGLEERAEVKEQQIETPERKGFVVVEWGGIEVR